MLREGKVRWLNEPPLPELVLRLVEIDKGLFDLV